MTTIDIQKVRELVKKSVSTELREVVELIKSSKQETEKIINGVVAWQEDHEEEHKTEKKEGTKLLTDILLKINTIAVTLEIKKEKFKNKLTIAALIISICAIVFGFIPKFFLKT